jgi:hypothetical protein
MLIPIGFFGGGAGVTGMELIETITTSSTSATFSSIPATYKHLQIRGTGKFANGSVNTFVMRFNGDTAANYSQHEMWARANLAGVQSNGSTSQTRMEMGYMFGGTSEPSPVIIDIWNAFNTATNKTVRAFNGTINNAGTSEQYIALKTGLWSNTSAVNSITLTTASGVNFSNARFSLYGIGG